MSRCIGVVAASDKVTVVDAKLNEDDTLSIISDQTWKLQKGDRATAFSTLFAQLTDHFKGADHIALKGSAVSLRGTKLAHLESCEIRGMVIAAAGASAKQVSILTKAHLSRKFGERKADEYLEDDDFWDDNITGVSLRAGSREAALIILFAHKICK